MEKKNIQNNWTEIKSLLKEKYTPQQQLNAISHTGVTTTAVEKDYWKRFEDLTGKDREQFRNQLNNY